MQGSASRRDRLVFEACAALGELGLAGLTIGAVAERAGVSTALIHYHFDTKQRLLVAATGSLAAARARSRSAALSARTGLQALDDLWDVVQQAAANGTERAYVELALTAGVDPEIRALLAEHRAAERAAIAAGLPALLAQLGAAPVAGLEELALVLTAALDGFASALLHGTIAATVRAAYDGFWLTLIAAGQGARS